MLLDISRNLSTFPSQLQSKLKFCHAVPMGGFGGLSPSKQSSKPPLQLKYKAL